MGCIVEFSEPLTRFYFCHNKHMQKMWIDALLKYGVLDINDLASVLDVSLSTLQNVYRGNDFFDTTSAEKLAQLFLILFSN